MNCPMQHEDDTVLILDYTAGVLDSSRTAEFERHLESCPACSAFTASHRATWAALDEWQPVAVSADFDRALYERIELEQRRSWVARMKKFWHTLRLRPAVPAAMLAACALAVVLLRPLPSPDRLDTPAARAENIDIDRMEEALEDMELLRELQPADNRRM